MKLTKGIKYQEDPQYKKIQDEQIQLKADRSRTQTQKTMDELLFPGATRRKPRQSAATQPAPVQTKKVEPKPTVQKKLPSIQETQQQNQKINKVPSVQKPIQTRPREEPKVVQPSVNIERVQNTGRQGFNRPSYIRKLKKIAENFEYAETNQRNHSFIDVVRPFQCDREKIQVQQQLNSDGNGYHDKQFPANWISIGKQYRKANIQWQRAANFSSKAAFGKYIQPNDIELGKLTCLSFASILSCLAQRQRNIKRIIQDQSYNSNGFYYVRLNINSVWRYIAVDDSLPMIDNDNVGLLSYKDSESDICLSLIEKAYAKAYNGYDVFAANCKPEHYLRDLTGSRVAKYSLNDNTLLDNVQFSLDQNWTVIAVPNNKIQELGLNSKFNLSIIAVTARGFQLRNSWGTISQRPKVNISKQGVFELTMQQAAKYFDYILVAQTDDRFHTTTVQSKHQAGFYSTYSFRISSSVQAVISASQWDHRFFPQGKKYDYAPFRVVFDRKRPGQTPQFVAGAYSNNQRNIDLLVQLSAGQYAVTCIGSWAGYAYDYSITLFGNHAVKFEKSYTEFLPNIISKSLQQLNLSTGKRSAKGHVDQYILYHEPTNLVLLTNINISDKPYDYVQDLSKINYSSLNLLNSPSENQTFHSKLAEQISAQKQTHNNDRRWSIHLQPKQAYTWVISTNQPYNLNNFKNWGFK